MNYNDQLKYKFLTLSQWEDLEDLFDYYFKSVQKLKDHPLDQKTIAFLLFVEKDKYDTYSVKKKNGEDRIIHAPQRNLKLTQKVLNDCIQLCFVPRTAAHGFVKGRSIVTNARMHLKRNFVYNIDLENFFPSIHFGRVFGVFKSHPFNYDDSMARYLANLCCRDGVLPQGAPTSPVLSNLVCRRLDRNLSKFAKEYRVKYSRYADDITFSSKNDIFKDQFLVDLEKIIELESFSINKNKVRLQAKHQKQMVTGLVVNKKVNVTKKYKADVRFLISLIEKEKENPSFSAQNWLNANYKNRQRYFGNVPKIEEVIRGKLDFMKMVVGEARIKSFNFYNKYLESQLKDEESTQSQDVSLDIVEINKKRQKEWEEEWKKYFEKNNEFLLENYDFDGICHPEELLDEYLIAETKVLDKLHIKERNNYHNPRKLAVYLSSLRNPDYGVLEKLAHENSELYEKALGNAKNELKRIDGKVKEERIPFEIYRSIEKFLKRLDSDERMESFHGKPMKDIVPKIKPLVYKFNRSYRFGLQQDELSLRKMILFLFSLAKEKYNKYKYLEVPQKLDLDFTQLTSTRNVFAAIELILSICQNRSNGFGAISIRSFKKANRNYLQIVDFGSYTNKHPKNIQDGTGDFGRLKAILWSYCDFNVYSIYGEENFKIPLLPKGKEFEKVDDKIDGFTYEFIFYEPIKILLVDDGKIEGETRLNQFYSLIEEHPNLNDIVKAVDELGPNIDLNDYNALFIHHSFKQYDFFIKKAIENDLITVTFSGGKYFYFNDKNPNSLTIGANEFYAKLVFVLKHAYENIEIDLSKFSPDFKNPSINNVSINQIIEEIERKKLKFPELDEEIYDLISKYTDQEIQMQFKSRKNLLLFLEDY
ncbi:MAG: RNA-directed DNA polymerase [Leptospiraceae bacterium]|nr:RNA-directed DNA polymerase [Leptospiraceae bacterium]